MELKEDINKNDLPHDNEIVLTEWIKIIYSKKKKKFVQFGNTEL